MKRILVIDDDALVCKTITQLLSRSGYDVVAARHSDEALLEFKKQAFHLVISDIRMPGKNGVDMVRAMREMFTGNFNSDLPIIFITGYADLSTELKAQGFGEVILKPFDLDHLLVTIREYL